MSDDQPHNDRDAAFHFCALPSGDFSLFEEADREVQCYSVALVGLSPSKSDPDGKVTQLASGTLVEFQGIRAILTAGHVVHQSNAAFHESDEIGIVLTSHEHNVRISRRMLDVHVIAGGPKFGQSGPDLGLIVLPPTFASTVSAIKSFWKIEKFAATMLEAPAPVNLGIWVLFGCPAESTCAAPPVGHFNKIMRVKGMLGHGRVSSEFRLDAFDYIDIPIEGNNEVGLPADYRGVSGGGIWHVPCTEDGGILKVARPLFSGVAFYQICEGGRISAIRCHGRRSVYCESLRFLEGLYS